MKFLSIFLIISHVFAFNVGGDNEDLPKCDSLLVRLSKTPIRCFGNPPSNIDFDIPEQQLNIEDLEKIFGGAESSGGRLVGPQNMPRIQEDLTPFPFRFSCDARLLSDGGKKVSWISFQQFLLNQGFYNFIFYPFNWEHRLTNESNVETTSFFSVPATPAVTFPLFEIKMSYDEKGSIFLFDLCEVRNSEDKRELFCSSEKISTNATRSSLSIEFKRKLRSRHKTVDFTLKVDCRRF